MDFTPFLSKKVNRFYGGANGNKCAIQMDGIVYMLKFPPKKEQLTIKYTNSCISEYLGCKIFESVGIPTQEVILGTVYLNGSNKVVVACKDFTSTGIVFQDFASVKNSCIISSNSGYGVELNEIKDAIQEQEVLPESIVTERFWDMFIVDALIGNFDRHNGNWGVLINTVSNQVELAPVFDCGSSLLPQANDDLQKRLMETPEEMDNRIYVFPTSAVKLNGKKINYHDFLVGGSDEECNKALERIVPRINLVHINQIIDNCEYINKTNKAFYKTYLSNRYEKILQKAYNKIVMHIESIDNKTKKNVNKKTKVR